MIWSKVIKIYLKALTALFFHSNCVGDINWAPLLYTQHIIILNELARDLLSDVGRKISERSGDEREIQFIFQHISVVVQQFNGVLLHDSFCVEDQPD